MFAAGHSGDGHLNSPLIVQTGRLTLRRLTEDDADFVLRLVNEEAFRENIGEKNLHTPEQAREFLRDGAWTCQPKAGYGQFLVESRATGEPLGICGLLYREELGVTDVGFALLPEARGRGYAVEAAAAAMEYARSRLAVTEIAALVAPGNQASIRVLEKLGMRFVAEVQSGGRPTLLYASRR